jgi:hypothetical protein
MIAEHISFTVIREDFSEYMTENGQLLRCKSVIMDIFTEEKEGKIVSGINFNEVSHVISFTAMDTSTFETAEVSSVSEKDEIKEVEFSVKKEIVNIYETNKGIILAAPQMQKIFLTNKKDKAGSPILRYRSNTAVNIIQKPTFTNNPDV